MVKRVVAKGGRLTPDGRLLFPKALVEDVIAAARSDIVLHGRRPGLEIEPIGDRVCMGSGGAAPSIIDLETGRYRPATARDLYDAARLVDIRPTVTPPRLPPRQSACQSAFSAFDVIEKQVVLQHSPGGR